MDTTTKQQKLSRRAINTILKLGKFVISRALYFVLGICVAVAISAVYAAWNTPVSPGDPLTSARWNEHVNKLIELDNRALSGTDCYFCIGWSDGDAPCCHSSDCIPISGGDTGWRYSIDFEGGVDQNDRLYTRFYCN